MRQQIADALDRDSSSVFRCDGRLAQNRRGQFLRSRVHMDETRLRALWPAIDIDVVRRHLEAIPKICAGTDASGPLGRLPLSQRFHWLVAPRSTVIQISPVHSGLICGSADEIVDRLFDELVAVQPTQPE